MLKNNKITTGVFLILALFNLVFPPIVRIMDGEIVRRKYFSFIFDMKEYQIDVKTLFLLFLICLIISVLIQSVVNFIQKKSKK